MIKLGKVARGRKCGAKGCDMKVEPGPCVEEHTGSGKWRRVKSYCRNHGTEALSKEREKLHKIEVAVYGEGGA